MKRDGKKRGFLFGLVLAALLPAVPTARAQMGQIYEEFGVSPRDSAMGNTGTAVADDYGAAFYNPAALVRAPGFQLDAGYKGVYPNLRMKIGAYGNRHFTRHPATNLALVGITWKVMAPRLIDPKWTERFTLGFVLAFSDYFKSFTIPYDTDTPYFFRYHDRYVNLLPMYFSASFRVSRWLSLGAGLVPAPSDTKISVAVNSSFRFPEYEYRATQGVVTRAYGKVEPILGMLLAYPRLGDDELLSFGLVWRDEVFTIDGEGHATNITTVHIGEEVIELPPANTPILNLTGWTPMQVVAAVGFSPLPGVTLTVEELWKRWSHWKNFFIERPEPNFRDTWNTRMGAEYRLEPGGTLVAAAFRLGGYREKSPVPDQNGETNILDPDKWVAGAGFETDWLLPGDVIRSPLRFGVSGQAHFMDRIHLHNNQDPDFPALDAWGEVYSFTLTLGVGTK